MKVQVLPLFLLAAVLCAHPQEDETKDCTGTTYEMSACLGRIYTKLDRELSETYKAALEAIVSYYEPRDTDNLKDAQRKWTAYRDAACRAEYGLWGKGTGGPLAHTQCRIRLTRQRSAEIKEAYLLK